MNSCFAEIHDHHGHSDCLVRLAGKYAFSGSAAVKQEKEVKNGD